VAIGIRLRAGATVAVSSLAILAAGCGGDGGATTATTPTTTKAAFVEQGDAILCTKSKAVATASKAISQEKSPSAKKLKAFVIGKVLPAVQRAHDDLAKLPVPEGDEDQVEAILKEMQTTIDATAANPASLLSGPDPFTKADRLITAYGLTGCPG
jgi:hypothetical protein